MSLRPFIPLCVLALLCACSSAPKAPRVEPLNVTRVPAQTTALPSNMRELRGQLLGVPMNGEAEVALLLVDERDRPLHTLASAHLVGDGAALPFRLRYSPSALAPGLRAELRARASQNGALTLHLPSKLIDLDASAQLGELRMLAAP